MKFSFFSSNRVWPLFLGLMTLLSSCAFSPKATEKLYIEASQKTYDVVVVPGVPFENGKWDRVMKLRVYWSKYLYEQGIAKNIMYSGSAVYSPYVEAEIMALYAEKLGIPKENIYTESKAEHSTENIYYSFKKAQNLGFETVALASDPFQSKMLKRFIRLRVDESVDLIPADIATIKEMEPEMTDPEIDYDQARVDSFVALPDRESFFKRLNGTRGKNINESYYNK